MLCRRQIGSSVAYKTIGTFLSQDMGRDDASGQATDGRKTVALQRYADAVAEPYPLDLPIDLVLSSLRQRRKR